MNTMNRFVQALSSLGFKGPVQAHAPTQEIASNESDKAAGAGDAAEGTISEVPASEDVVGFIDKPKDKLLDRCLDKVVKFSGSEIMFFGILAALLAWAFAGIRFGQSTDWAVVISDVQAILSYIFDSLLMRQQLNEYEMLMTVAASLQSRNVSTKRMLHQILRREQYRAAIASEQEKNQDEQIELLADLPTENWLGRLSTTASIVLGHIITLGLYWICIFIWIGFGPYCQWSDQWQLYINSSTSALMVLIFAFLANIQERHRDYSIKCLDSLYHADSALERKLRIITGDTTPNPTVTVAAPKMNRLQRAIFYYADLVGTLVGVTILIIVIVAWVAIGPLMSFNSNWWLLIGTYAGLIGMHDGFVLRNVQDQLDTYNRSAFQSVNFEDLDILSDMHVSDPASTGTPDADVAGTSKPSLSFRLSVKMSKLCSNEWTVVLGVVTIFGLIIGASVMKWTVTGQLLCNVPPSLIESFIMMVLITGHNITEEGRRTEFRAMYLRRLKLVSMLDRLNLKAE